MNVPLYVVSAIPGIAISGAGWWITLKMKPSGTRARVRAALLSIAFAPTVYRNVWTPAFAPIFTSNGDWGWWFAGVIALAAGWLVLIPIASLIP